MSDQEEEKGGDPIFMEYPSIENHYRDSIKEMVDKYTGTELWVATEKVHGSNFSFIFTKENGIQCASRNKILAAGEAFNNYQVIQKKYAAKVPEIFEILAAEIPGLTQVTVFGEFYGGIYPGIKTKVKKIQDGIYYTPDLEFEAFDLFYKTAENPRNIYPYKEACQHFAKLGIPFAAILKEGTLKELYATLDPEVFQSTIYAKFGLPKLDDNLAEGYVIKPNEAIFLENERFSIKIKSSKNLEGPGPVARLAMKEEQKKADKIVAKGEITPEQQAIITQLLTYINKNRVESALSKLTDAEKLEEKKVIKMVDDDAWKDFKKEQTQEVQQLA